MQLFRKREYLPQLAGGAPGNCLANKVIDFDIVLSITGKEQGHAISYPSCLVQIMNALALTLPDQAYQVNVLSRVETDVENVAHLYSLVNGNVSLS